MSIKKKRGRRCDCEKPALSLDGVCRRCHTTWIPSPDVVDVLVECYPKFEALEPWERRRILSALSVLCEMPLSMDWEPIPWDQERKDLDEMVVRFD